MTPELAKATYARALKEILVLRRYTGQGANRPIFELTCHGRVTGYAPNELVGSVVQGDRKVILLAQDLINAQVRGITTKDKLVVRGKELAIIAADDSTRRVNGVLIAYELQVRG